jgi:hypothetical protein
MRDVRRNGIALVDCPTVWSPLQTQLASSINVADRLLGVVEIVARAELALPAGRYH